jgi:hypothetical protein
VTGLDRGYTPIRFRRVYVEEGGLVAGFFSRVTVVNPSSGATETLYRKKGRRRKKRVSRALRPLERAVFHSLEATDAAAGNLLSRHRRSRRKRRDGWLRDAPNNVMKAHRRGWKKLRKI